MRFDFSAVGFLEFACYAFIFFFFVRYLAARYHDRSVGKALGYIFF